MTEVQALASQKVAIDLQDVIEIKDIYTSKTNQKLCITEYDDVMASLKNITFIKKENGDKLILCDLCEQDDGIKKTFTAQTSFK